MEALIRDAIDAGGGAVPFARFMELALYAPGLGYYERSPRPVGRRGDFYTSVSVGPLLGEMLGFQFARWMEDPKWVATEAPLHLVEAGAHDGRLAADLLSWLKAWRPALFPRIQLWLVEPSSSRTQWQRETLAGFEHAVHWVANLSELKERTGGVGGLFYSNELLDAFPVHRLAWSAALRTWQELGVGYSEGRFVWTPLPLNTATAASEDLARLAVLPGELLAVLPDGFAIDTSPAAAAWWRQAAGVLREGVLMTLDYGFNDGAMLRPEHPAGTLRAYRRHQQGRDILAHPGEQDLTASVDFESIACAGETLGLSTRVRSSQRLWLTEIFEATLASDAGFPPWDPPRIRQFQTLTHPEHLGRRFQVLVQTRL